MKYFGTDGIRQKAEKFTPEFLYKIVAGLVDYAGDNISVLVAGDTRESTEWIFSDLAVTLETLGVEYAIAGVLPTPAINYCFYKMGFDYAIDVTASHNPYKDNGIKIFERGKKSGQKLNQKACEAIERSLLSAKPYALASITPREDLHDEAVELYKNHLRDYVGEVDLKGLKIGLDCANGATSVINKTVFEELGATVELINSNEGFGTEINNNCGSTHLEQLKSLVKENSLDFGVAFDGDGDRVLMIDEDGNEIDGDQIIAILASYLKLDKIAITVMANQGLLNWAKDNNIETEITPVGDTNVFIAMREKAIEIGGEQSGHVILPGEATGDGMLTALMVAKVVAKMKKSLKKLAGVIAKFPQIIVNLEASPEQKDSFKSGVAENLLKEYEKSLEEVSGRLLVRPSGTENLIRITMWGDDKAKIETLANELKTKLGEFL